MRQLIVTALFAALSTSTHAKCVPQVCYAVSFEIANCRATRDERPPLRVRKVNGIILKASESSARPVPCGVGYRIPEGGLPSVEQIEGTREFFYSADSCETLLGRKVTLFAPEVCCDTGPCAVPERPLTALPIWAQ